MNEKFGGVGLKNIFVIWMFVMVFTLMLKTIVVKLGLSDNIQTVVLAV